VITFNVDMFVENRSNGAIVFFDEDNNKAFTLANEVTIESLSYPFSIIALALGLRYC
jgi:hypothetical protein